MPADPVFAHLHHQLITNTYIKLLARLFSFFPNLTLHNPVTSSQRSPPPHCHLIAFYGSFLTLLYRYATPVTSSQRSPPPHCHLIAFYGSFLTLLYMLVLTLFIYISWCLFSFIPIFISLFYYFYPKHVVCLIIMAFDKLLKYIYPKCIVICSAETNKRLFIYLLFIILSP